MSPGSPVAVCPHSSMAHGLVHCTCAALAPPPHCTPCSLEGDRRGLSGQGKVAGWWLGELGLGLVAKPCVATRSELSWQLCPLPALGWAAWWGTWIRVWELREPHAQALLWEEPQGGTAPFPTTSESGPGPPASADGSRGDCLCPEVGFPVWRNDNSLLPLPFQHREHPDDRWPWPGESVMVRDERFPGAAAWQSQHGHSHLHSPVIRSDKLGVREGG